MKLGIIGKNFGEKVIRPAFESLGCDVSVRGREGSWDLIDESDAIIVACPPEAHAGYVLACLDRGKPVLCEKPCTASLMNARDLAGMGKGYVGFQFRYHLPAGNHMRVVLSIKGKSKDVVRDYGCHVFDYMRWCIGAVEIEHVMEQGDCAVIKTNRGGMMLSSRGNLGHQVWVDNRHFDLYGDRIEMYKPLAQDFLDAIEGRPNILPTFADAVEAWKLIEKCHAM